MFDNNECSNDRHNDDHNEVDDDVFMKYSCYIYKMAGQYTICPYPFITTDITVVISVWYMPEPYGQFVR